MMDHGFIVVIGMLMVFVGISTCLRFRYANHPFVSHPKRIEFRTALRLFNSVYANKNTHHISHLARARDGVSEDSLIYGEIDGATFVTILEMAKPVPGEQFYDFGSGAGKAVLVAALFFNIDAKGVERLSGLHEFALDQLTQLKQLVHADRLKYARFLDRCERIQFVQDDIVKYPFYDADILFVNATCFHYTLWTQLVECFKYLKRGARLIVVSKKIDDVQFKLVHEAMYQMSWGDAGVKIYRKEQ